MRITRNCLTLIVATFISLQLFAQDPIYIVNGEARNSVVDIPQDQIENIVALELTDDVVAQYGERASGGVFLVTLKYDVAPKFKSEGSFMDYIVANVKWDVTDPTARFAVRYRIDTYGNMILGEVLESTERRLKKKILKVLEEAPGWEPATKNGQAVTISGVLKVQLPVGRKMNSERYVVTMF